MLAALAGLIIIHPPIPAYTSVDYDRVVSILEAEQTRCQESRWRKTCLQDSHVETIAFAVLEAGEAHDIDPYWLLAVSSVESGRWKPWVQGDCKERNPKRRCAAWGMFQIHTNTARGRVGTGSPCVKAAGSRKGCGQWALRCKLGDSTQCVNAIDTSVHTAAWLFKRYRDKWPGHGAVVYNCGPTRCCADLRVEKSGRKRCKRQARWTGTVKKYWRTYRKLLVTDIAVKPGVGAKLDLQGEPVGNTVKATHAGH
jgi:hypothetical protein